MPAVSERVAFSRDIPETIARNVSKVVTVLEVALGPDECNRQQEVHPPTWRHQVETGALAMGLMDMSLCGTDRDIYGRAAGAVGGGHDAFKTKNATVMGLVDFPGDIGLSDRHWLTYTHCNIDADPSFSDAIRKRTPLGRYILHGMKNHHGLFVSHGEVPRGDPRCQKPLIQPMPTPAEYTKYRSDYALAWALTHVTYICDRLHALAFDQSREVYREKLEGVRHLPSAQIYGIVIQPGHANPVLKGRELPADVFVRRVLGLPEDLELER